MTPTDLDHSSRDAPVSPVIHPHAPVARASKDSRAGLLAIDKPAGPTSHDVVERVARRLRLARAGHVGTLDPGATGLLLVATGAATRCVPVWQGGDKTYEAVIEWGVVTASQDLDGEVLERRAERPAEADVREAARAFAGDIDQVPPMVSAVRVGGERLHALARRGVEIERAPRRVTIRRWEWLDFERDRARVRITCTSGTYVRTLAHDLGQRLGCGAALASLRRLRSEPFDVARAIPLAELDQLAPDVVWARAGLTLEQALEHLPALVVHAHAEAEIGHGRRPSVGDASLAGLPIGGAPRSVVVRSAASGRVLALGSLHAGAGGDSDAPRLHPDVVFPWTVR